MSPGLNHQIGGPEGFYLGQLFWKTDFTFKFRRNLLLYSSLGFNIYDTFDDFANPSQSTIPKVRSDIQEYLSEGKNNIQMQLSILINHSKTCLLGLIWDILNQWRSWWRVLWNHLKRITH